MTNNTENILRFWIDMELMDFPDIPDKDSIKGESYNYNAGGLWEYESIDPWNKRGNPPATTITKNGKVYQPIYLFL